MIHSLTRPIVLLQAQFKRHLSLNSKQLAIFLTRYGYASSNTNGRKNENCQQFSLKTNDNILEKNLNNKMLFKDNKAFVKKYTNELCPYEYFEHVWDNPESLCIKTSHFCEILNQKSGLHKPYVDMSYIVNNVKDVKKNIEIRKKSGMTKNNENIVEIMVSKLHRPIYYI